MFLPSVKEIPICRCNGNRQLLLIPCAFLVHYYTIIHYRHEFTTLPQLAIYKYAVAFGIEPLTSCCNDTMCLIVREGYVLGYYPYDTSFTCLVNAQEQTQCFGCFFLNFFTDLIPYHYSDIT